MLNIKISHTLNISNGQAHIQRKWEEYNPALHIFSSVKLIYVNGKQLF